MTYAIETIIKCLVRSTEIRSLITDNTLRDKIRNEDICTIQNVTRWARIRKRIWRDHVNKMNDNQLAKIARNGKPNIFRTAYETLMRKLDINITGEQTH